jgi:uncharacterized protein (DUF362 family)
MDSISKPRYQLSRRDFLKLGGTASAALALSACGIHPAELTSPTPGVTIIPSAPMPGPTETPRPEPAPTATPAFKTQVALGKATTYDPGRLRPVLEGMLAGLGGLDKLIKSGARVGIKANLTGGTWWDTPDRPPATEFFVTHPAVVGVLCELLRDLGAGRLLIMDGLGDPSSFSKWGYTAMAQPLNAELIDLCKPDPHPSFVNVPVGPQALVFDQFAFNPALTEIDVFISVGKMKTHSVGGVTLAMKNLFGLVPISLYRRAETHNNRSLFHDGLNFDSRLAKIILDLNLACPIHLAVIDGIMTADRGAGPWDKEMIQVKPGVLAVGLNAVATDAIATALMGFAPAAEARTAPFLHTENYLSLARELGLGTNLPEEIGLVGESLENMSFPFHLPA